MSQSEQDSTDQLNKNDKKVNDQTKNKESKSNNNEMEKLVKGNKTSTIIEETTSKDNQPMKVAEDKAKLSTVEMKEFASHDVDTVNIKTTHEKQEKKSKSPIKRKSESPFKSPQIRERSADELKSFEKASSEAKEIIGRIVETSVKSLKNDIQEDNNKLSIVDVDENKETLEEKHEIENLIDKEAPLKGNRKGIEKEQKVEPRDKKSAIEEDKLNEVKVGGR